MTRQTLKMCAFAAVLAAAACGPNNDPNNVFVPNNNTNNTNNNSSNNTNNQSNNSNGGTNNTIPPNSTIIGCEEVDIEAFVDASVDISREFRESTEVELLGCRNDVGEIATDGSYVVSLRYTQDTEVSISVTAIRGDGGVPPRPGLELRDGTCVSDDISFCDTQGSYDATLRANTTYFLFVNGLLSSGGFNLTVEPDVLPCTQTCEAGTLTLCEDDGTPVESTCPTDCAGDACTGDNCDNPITVSPTLNGDAEVITGNRGSFSSAWDAMAGEGCDPDGGGNVTTPGPELLVLVQGATAGQRIIMDADASEDAFQFYVIDDCEATTCTAAFSFDENARNRGEYVPSADGDVLFAVEAAGNPEPSDFTIEVSLRD